MSKVREVLRLRWALGRSVREAARAANVSVGVVSSIERRASVGGLAWAAVEGLDDVQLERRLYGGPKHTRGPSRVLPDPAWMHAELRRAGVTLELLHLEYLREHPNGYRYTAFCDAYRLWVKRRGLVMRQQHKAGDKTFVDYATVRLVQLVRATGKTLEQVEVIHHFTFRNDKIVRCRIAEDTALTMAAFAT